MLILTSDFSFYNWPRNREPYNRNIFIKKNTWAWTVESALRLSQFHNFQRVWVKIGKIYHWSNFCLLFMGNSQPLKVWCGSKFEVKLFEKIAKLKTTRNIFIFFFLKRLWRQVMCGVKISSLYFFLQVE